jgi:hypothetical protein
MIMELAVATGWPPDHIRRLTIIEHAELVRALNRARGG